MGVIRDVSQSGVALEIYGDPQSVRILISFVDVAGKITVIKGKTVYIRRINPGKIRMGVLLLGNPTENIGFVKELVRFHHYTKKSKSG